MLHPLRILVVALAMSAALYATTASAPAQTSLVTLTPFCNPSNPIVSSGFYISSTRSDLLLKFTAGNLAGGVYPSTDSLVFDSSPFRIGPTTVQVFQDVNGNGFIDPGEPLLETLNLPDPCAPPLPSSREQCKKGGWQSFGVFKNQGDCVSFVATRGKNQPG